MSLKINPKFKEAIPPLAKDEYDKLRESILADGCRDAIITWRGYIADGHNRHEICTRAGIEYATVEMSFFDEDKALEWILFNQLARRNLSDVERGRIALKLKGAISAQARARQALAGGDKKSEEAKTASANICQSDISIEERAGESLSANLHQAIESGKTMSILAKQAGIGERTLAKIEKVDTEAPEIVKQHMEKGSISIDKAAQINRAIKQFPVEERELEATRMVAKDVNEQYEEAVRETRIIKKLTAVMMCAVDNHDYIADEYVEIYLRRGGIGVDDTLRLIDNEIGMLHKLRKIVESKNKIRLVK